MTKHADDAARFYNELARESLDHCVKCTICETVCPILAVTPLFPGPKFVGPQGERFRHGDSVDISVDYCSSCGACTLACPQGVKVAELNSMARAAAKAEHGMPLRDRLISQTTLMGKAMNPVAPLANALLANKAVRVVLEKTMGIAAGAPMPVAPGETIQQWLRRRPKPTGPAPRGPIIYFHGCAGAYFEVETSRQAIEVLERLGYEVLVPKQGCCGLAQQSNGLFKEATASVRKLVSQLRAAGSELMIVSSSGSCTGMLKHEAHEILGIDDAELADVGTRIRDICEFLLELHQAGQLPVDEFAAIDETVAYHAPCQLKSQGMGLPAVDVLGLIPELKVVESGVTCCGIAGTYGLKRGKYDVAQEVAEPLFEMISNNAGPRAACDTETCRWQIRKGTGVETVHPVAFVHRALGLAP